MVALQVLAQKHTLTTMKCNKQALLFLATVTTVQTHRFERRVSSCQRCKPCRARLRRMHSAASWLRLRKLVLLMTARRQAEKILKEIAARER
jgi:hypothetical protein